MQIIPLSEGAFTIDKTKLFVPFDTGQDDLQQRPVGSLMVEVQPFAVITVDDILVIDTGLGFEKDGKLQTPVAGAKSKIDLGSSWSKVERSPIAIGFDNHQRFRVNSAAPRLN